MWSSALHLFQVTSVRLSVLQSCQVPCMIALESPAPHLPTHRSQAVLSPLHPLTSTLPSVLSPVMLPLHAPLNCDVTCHAANTFTPHHPCQDLLPIGSVTLSAPPATPPPLTP
jgi:hypothetical protein